MSARAWGIGCVVMLVLLVGLTAGQTASGATNVALGGKFLSDGGWWQGGNSPFDGNTGEYSGIQPGWTEPNRLFGVRLPGTSQVDSFQLYITGGPGGRDRPKDLKVYWDGGSTTVTCPNANAVVSLGQSVKTNWLVFREMSDYTNGDANYFLNELEVYDNTNTPVVPRPSVVTSITGAAPMGGGSVAAMDDGNFFGSGAFYALGEAGGSAVFTAALQPGKTVDRIALTQDIADGSNADQLAWNMARQITLQFNDPANTTFVLGNLNSSLATGRDYDHIIPLLYNMISLPQAVSGATQVIVTMTKQDPENYYGPGPATPTLPIGNRTTWGTAASDNNRWGVIEFEAFEAPASAVPEPASIALISLGAMGLLLGRRR